MKRIFVLLIVMALFFPIVSANLGSSFSEIETYINSYNNGEITAPQLIVYIEYIHNKMYKDGSRGFSESEIKNIFDKTDANRFNNIEGIGIVSHSYDKGDDNAVNNMYMGEYGGADYKKEYKAKDFNIVFYANSFIRQDKEYYEDRHDSERFYFIDYDLVSNNGIKKSANSVIYNFISELKKSVKNDETNTTKLKKDFNHARNILQQSGECSGIFSDLGFDLNSKDYESTKKEYTLQIESKNDKNCWTDSICEPKQEIKKDCYNEPGNCHNEEKCEEVCIFENTTIIPNSNKTTNETIDKVCHDECHTEQICEDDKEVCNEYTDYQNDCHDEEKCDEFVSGELSLGGNCGEDYSDIYLNAWGPYEKYNEINDFNNWNCESEINNLVSMRQALEKDFNQKFIDWYFNDFLDDDLDKIINGENGIESVIRKFIRIDEDIANNIQCSESKEWPKGFNKIDISYSNDNVNLEVWEKMIPVDAGIDYYTTLYKYSWAPNKEFAKELITYMLNNESFGPGARDIAKIKADEGQMDLIKSISDRYGGSFDIAVTLKEKNSDFNIKKYLEINPDVAIKISNEIKGNTDISIDIDYDTLYNFIRQMTSKFDGNRIRGPYWVNIEENNGGSNFFSAFGLISKAWREGVTIKPRYALIKLFFSVKDVVGFLSDNSQQVNPEDKAVITGKVVLDRE